MGNLVHGTAIPLIRLLGGFKRLAISHIVRYLVVPCSYHVRTIFGKGAAYPKMVRRWIEGESKQVRTPFEQAPMPELSPGEAKVGQEDFYVSQPEYMGHCLQSKTIFADCDGLFIKDCCL